MIDKRPRFNQAQSSALIAALCLLSVLGWAALYRWYALFDHYATPGFALDRVPGHLGSAQLRLTALIFVVLVACYAGIYWLLKRTATLSPWVKLALAGLIGVAAAINIGLYPVGAIDLFSYLGQLKLVYVYHQNPYLATFLPMYAADPLVRFAPFLELPLVYGPAWVALAGWPLRLAGFGDLLQMLIAYKLWSLLFVLVSGWCIYLGHEEKQSGWLGAYLFLANPLVLFEALGNAHNDVIMAAFLLGAALAARRRSWLALPLVLIAALIKAFALILVPAFLIVMYRQRWSRARMLGSIALAAGVSCLVIWPFWAGGAVVGAMLRAVALQQQAFETVSLVSLAREYAQHAPALLLGAIRLGFGALFVVAAIAALLSIQERNIDRALVYLLLLFYILVSSLYPWYLIPVIGLLALDLAPLGLAYVFAASALALLSYLVNIWARFDAGLSLFEMRLCVAACLTLPILVFVCSGPLSARSRLGNLLQPRCSVQSE